MDNVQDVNNIQDQIQEEMDANALMDTLLIKEQVDVLLFKIQNVNQTLF